MDTQSNGELALSQSRAPHYIAVRIAYHEASHAVVAHALGWAIQRVWMAKRQGKEYWGLTLELVRRKPQTRYYGACEAAPQHPLAGSADDERCIEMASTAGELMLARSRKWRGRGRAAYGPDFHADDWEEAYASLTGMPDGERRQMLISAEERARTILEQPEHWHAVEMIAEALLSCFTVDHALLYGQDAHGIIRQALGEKKAGAGELAAKRKLNGVPSDEELAMLHALFRRPQKVE